MRPILFEVSLNKVKRMRRVLFAVLLLVAGSSVLFASSPIKEGYMISGHVIEKETEEDIPYATVLIEER